jgi:hypothetical protein
MTSLISSVLQRPSADWAFHGRPGIPDIASSHLQEVVRLSHCDDCRAVCAESKQRALAKA